MPKHKTIIEGLHKIKQNFKTVRLGLYQNQHNALTSMNVQTNKIVACFCGRSFGEIPIVL